MLGLLSKQGALHRCFRISLLVLFVVLLSISSVGAQKSGISDEAQRLAAYYSLDPRLVQEMLDFGVPRETINQETADAYLSERVHAGQSNDNSSSLLTAVQNTDIWQRHTDSEFGISFEYPVTWTLQEEKYTTGGYYRGLEVYKSRVANIAIARLSNPDHLTPREWFQLHPELYNDLMSEIGELDMQGNLALITGLPNTCRTVPMIVATVSHDDFMYIIKHYEAASRPAAVELGRLLETLVFDGQQAGTTTIPSSHVQFPDPPQNFSCPGIQAASVAANALKCTGAPMLIPTTGYLLSPWRCLGTGPLQICEPYYPRYSLDQTTLDPHTCDEGATDLSYYKCYPHSGIDIAGEKRVPVYAPYNGVVQKRGNHSSGLRIKFASIPSISGEQSAWFSHMATIEDGQYIDLRVDENGNRIQDGLRVTAGQQIGQQGDYGTETVHLHLSFSDALRGHGDYWIDGIAHLGDPNGDGTLNPTFFLKAKHLVYSQGWTRQSDQSLACEEHITPQTSAQNGVTWLQAAAVEWQNGNRCIGCHVQPMAIQAAAIAKNNGFAIDATAVNTLIEYTKAQQRSNGDFCCDPVGEEHYVAAGFAAYDRFINEDARPNLVSLSNWLLSQQQADGRWNIPHHEPPVDQGNILATTNAINILAQAYRRTENLQFSTAMQLGARWLESQLNSAVTTQDKTHIIIGLIASGRAASDSAVQTIADKLKDEQREDGGWLDTNGGVSTAYGTGQTLYALRLAGVRLDDPIVHEGVTWLIEQQEPEGSWPLTDNSNPGRRSKYSPTMWGALGLVQAVDLTPPTMAPPILPVHVPTWTSFVIELIDNLAGSGVNPASVVASLDGVVVPSFYIPALNRVIVFVNPLQVHAVGLDATLFASHVLTIDARDNQDNLAPQLVINFTVDTGLLAVESVTPSNGAINVPVDTKIRATFNLPTDMATVTPATISLSDAANQPVAGTVSFDSNTKTATFAPTLPLSFNSYYVLKVHGDEIGVHNTDGQPMVMDYEFGFRTVAETGDVVPPTVTSVALQENGSITVQFSELMDPFTVNGSTILLMEKATGINVSGVVGYESAIHTATFTPLVIPDFSRSYQLRVRGQLGGVADLAGNPMTEDHVSNSLSTILSGDCNADQSLGAADMTALALEFFDGDDNTNPAATSGGTLAGSPACDANEDNQIGASDLTCIALLFFNGPGACTTGQSAATAVPTLSLPSEMSVNPGSQITLPITLQSNGAAPSSLLFSLDYDEQWLSFDPSDQDQDGIPDALTFHLPEPYLRSATVDVNDQDGEVDILIASFAASPEPLPDGAILSITLANGTPMTTTAATVGFGQNPAPSFGDKAGHTLVGAALDGSVQISGTTVAPALPPVYLPLIVQED